MSGRAKSTRQRSSTAKEPRVGCEGAGAGLEAFRRACARAAQVLFDVDYICILTGIEKWRNGRACGTIWTRSFLFFSFLLSFRSPFLLHIKTCVSRYIISVCFHIRQRRPPSFPIFTPPTLRGKLGVTYVLLNEEKGGRNAGGWACFVVEAECGRVFQNGVVG